MYVDYKYTSIFPIVNIRLYNGIKTACLIKQFPNKNAFLNRVNTLKLFEIVKSFSKLKRSRYVI